MSIEFGRFSEEFCNQKQGHLKFMLYAGEASLDQKVVWDIPDGLEIIGLEGRVDGYGISSLSLLLWSSNELELSGHLN